MRITEADLVDIIRVINRRLEKHGYNVRLELEYRIAAVGSSNVYQVDVNGSKMGWPVFAGKRPAELNDLLKAYWKGLSLGLMESEKGLF